MPARFCVLHRMSMVFTISRRGGSLRLRIRANFDTFRYDFDNTFVEIDITLKIDTILIKNYTITKEISKKEMYNINKLQTRTGGEFGYFENPRKVVGSR